MEQPICAVVGVGPKIGKAVAEAFAGKGYQLVLISRNQSHLKEHVRELERKGAAVHMFEADATDERQLHARFTEVFETVGVPEVVVYNPAIIAEEKPSELTPEGLQPYFEVMLYGALNSVNAVLPKMRERGSGTLLFTGGGFGIEPSVELSSHSIGKAALRNYARALFKELEPEGLHAATVTITRPVQPGEDMESAAQQFVKLHDQEKGQFDWEIVYGD